MEKQSRFDRLMQKMKEAERAGPHSILSSSKAQSTVSGASASDPARKKPLIASSGKPFSVEGEEGVKEDPSVDLRQKKRKWKVSEASAEEAALGVDSVWEHGVNPIDRAFPADYNFWAALDTGLTNGPIREILGKRAKGSLESKKEENRVKGAEKELQYQSRVLTPRRHYPRLGVAEPPSPFSLIHHPTPRRDARRLGMDEAARKMTLHQGLNA
ncbi:hypothetical protein PIB30_099394 [Stylosanthes scabra]|uniref:Uncharacterized protein n=1 Tax=Stylosanthes scabra TaxID=79078 RepID=A0ABU6TYB6_9FABA|nr:hypothetical protein [Stylosanthes scabra]